MNKSLIKSLAAAGLLGSLFFSNSALAAGEINVYTERQYDLLQPLIDAFTTKTGIKVNTSYDKNLLDKIKQEGNLSPADVYITVGIDKLVKAKQEGLTQAFQSATLDQNVPAAYRDNKNHWYGLSLRARVIYTSKDRVGKLPVGFEYSELAKPEYKGKVCARSGKHNYNVALFASYIAHYGEAKGEQFIRGLKNNLATKPAGGDRDQVKNITEGLCDYSLGNSYYYGKMIDDPKQKAWADASDINFPSMAGQGTMVNISGAVLLKSSKHKSDAIKFIEFLTDLEAQKIYADINHEYPVNPKSEKGRLTSTWGDFKIDNLPLATIAQYYDTALKIVDAVDFDNVKAK